MVDRGSRCKAVAWLGFLSVVSMTRGAEAQPGWSVELAPSLVGGPPVALADLDGDGQVEIVVGAGPLGIKAFRHDGSLVPGWPFVPPDGGGGPPGQPVVGDIDGDGAVEVVCIANWPGGNGLRVFALTGQGQVVPGWPVILNELSVGLWELALGDLDGDGAQEVVVPDSPYGDELKIFALDGDGSALAGWPVFLPPPTDPAYSGQIYLAGMAIGDVDFDSVEEVVAAYWPYSDSGNLMQNPVYLIDGDGTLRSGWPILPYAGGSLENPMIVDFDGDQEVEIILPGSNRLYAYEADASFEVPYGSGFFSAWNRNAAGDFNGDGAVDFVLGGLQLTVYDLLGRYVLEHTPLDGDGSEPIYAVFHAPTVGDVDGDGSPEILVWSGSTDGVGERVLHLYDASLADRPGWPRAFAPYSTPGGSQYSTEMADLDGDGDVEIVHTYINHLYVWEEPNDSGQAPAISWGMVGHDARKGFFYHAGELTDPVFVRGDANRSGVVDVSDVVAVVKYVYLGEESSCAAQMDVEGDGVVEVGDALGIIAFLFGGGPPPAAPFPECGFAPETEVTCWEFFCP